MFELAAQPLTEFPAQSLRHQKVKQRVQNHRKKRQNHRYTAMISPLLGYKFTATKR